MVKTNTRENCRYTGSIVLLCFFMAGATALTYEVLWTRMFSLVIGGTSLAITTVITTFMGGLALGSFIGGRYADRVKTPLLAYGLLELAIGCFGLLIPFFVDWIKPIFALIFQAFQGYPVIFSLLQFTICCLVLIIPTTLMGATLPVLSKFFTKSGSEFGGSLSKFYGFNTLGASCGAFATGFFLIPAMGMMKTNLLAVGVNLLIAVIVFLLQRSRDEVSVSGQVVQQEIEPVVGLVQTFTPRTTRAVLLAIAISGFAAMAYQLAWTRLLILNFGSSTYSFSMILTIVILGIGMGSLFCTRWIDKKYDPLFILAIVQILIATVSLVMMPAMGNWLPIQTIKIVGSLSNSIFKLQLAEFGVAAGLILVPATLMGMTFPLACKICAGGLQKLGRSIGTVYAVNTLGAIAGSMCAGFILLPLYGLQITFIIGALISLATGCFLILNYTAFKLEKRCALVTIILFSTAFGLIYSEDWDEMIMDSGPYIYANIYKSTANKKGISIQEAITYNRKTIFREESAGAVVTVKLNTQNRTKSLVINGKADASSTGDMGTQILCGQLPLLLTKKMDDVLLIGLGSGVTAGSVLTHPVKRLDCIEISPAVARAAKYFDSINNNVLADSRLNTIFADGRNFLLSTDRSYDVIVSEPSNPWIAGIANLFTEEFYKGCREKLKAEGLFCQWMHAYSMDPEDFRMVVNTFTSVFPNATLWEASIASDFLLVATLDDMKIDLAMLQKRMAANTVKKDLKRILINKPRDLFSAFVAGGKPLSQYAHGARKNLDDNALLEFSAPLNLFLGTNGVGFKSLNAARESVDPYVIYAENGLTSIDMANIFKAKGHVLTALRSYQQTSRRTGRRLNREELSELKLAVKIDPGHRYAALTLEDHYQNRATTELAKGEIDKALISFEKAVEFNPVNPIALSNLAGAYARSGQMSRAEKYYRMALAIDINDAILYHNLGIVLSKIKDRGAAIRCFETALKLNPHNVDLIKKHLVVSSFNYGNDLHSKGDNVEAIKCFQRTLELAPAHQGARNNIAGLLFKQGEYIKAAREYNHLMAVAPQHKDGLFNSGFVYYKLNKKKKFTYWWNKFCKAYPLDPRTKTVMAVLAKVDLNPNMEIIQ